MRPNIGVFSLISSTKFLEIMGRYYSTIRRALLIFVVIVVCGCKLFRPDAYSGSTLIWESGANNYFNRDEPTSLKFSNEILITGELDKDVKIKLSGLPWHSVTVKEVVPQGDSMVFKGAFRYDGYALCDILSTVKVNKWKGEEFYPPVDLFVEVWNQEGEYAVFSWGEIFYAADVYKIILARSVSRVIPGKTKELWQLPEFAKIVAGTDHNSVRNISNPVKIVIRSLRGNFKVDRNPQVFRSDSLIIEGDRGVGTVDATDMREQIIYKTHFYGQSMGYKGVKVYKGISLKDKMESLFSNNPQLLSTAMLCIEATDGYRAAFSLSEIINRNDGMESVLMYGGNEEGRGGFSLFSIFDMFADRAIKSISRISIYKPADFEKPSGDLIVFHAGSLAAPMKEIADSFMRLYPGVKVLAEASGSIDAARKITELGRDCDIIASADYSVIENLLIPNYTNSCVKFATNEMAIVYTERSKYANIISESNWLEILSGRDVTVGRSDPNADPCGYRTLLVLDLASKFYAEKDKSASLRAEAIKEKDKRYIRPKEVDLLALLDAGAVDYIFLYKSVAVQHGLKYLELPPEVNLGDPSKEQLYSKVSVTVRGSKPGDKMVMRGQAMVYGASILSGAPNRAAAEAFMNYLTSSQGGGAILLRMGQGPYKLP